MPTHCHLVKAPGWTETKTISCSIPENECTLGQATPEEIWFWSAQREPVSFDVWLAEHRRGKAVMNDLQEHRRRKALVEQIAKSDSLIASLDEAAGIKPKWSCPGLAEGRECNCLVDGTWRDHRPTMDFVKKRDERPQKSTQMPLTFELPDGRKEVVGSAHLVLDQSGEWRVTIAEIFSESSVGTGYRLVKQKFPDSEEIQRSVDIVIKALKDAGVSPEGLQAYLDGRQS